MCVYVCVGTPLLVYASRHLSFFFCVLFIITLFVCANNKKNKKKIKKHTRAISHAGIRKVTPEGNRGRQNRQHGELARYAIEEERREQVE